MISDTSSQDREIKTNKKYLLKIILLLIGIGILFIFLVPNVSSFTTNSVPKNSLKMASVVRGDLVEQFKVQGKIVSLATPTLYSSAQGYVHFLVQSGDLVAKGQHIASIKNPDLLSELEQEQRKLKNILSAQQRLIIKTQRDSYQAQRNIELSKMRHTAIKQEFKRSENGVKIGIVTSIAHDELAYRLHIAQVKTQYAQKDYQLLKKHLEFELDIQSQEVELQKLRIATVRRKVAELKLVSPSDGVVGDILLSQNSAIENARPLLTIVDHHQLAIEVEIPESYAPKLNKFTQFDVNVFNSELSAKIVAISPEIIKGKFQVRAKFTNAPPKQLKQNQSITVLLAFKGKTNVLKLVKGPFLDTNEGKYAFVVKGDEAIKTNILLGKESQREVEVISGLNEGDVIVVSSIRGFSKNERLLIN